MSQMKRFFAVQRVEIDPALPFKYRSAKLWDSAYNGSFEIGEAVPMWVPIESIKTETLVKWQELGLIHSADRLFPPLQLRVLGWSPEMKCVTVENTIGIVQQRLWEELVSHPEGLLQCKIICDR